jgi:hypothetical protein
VPVSDGGGHGGDACLDVNKLGIEVFSSVIGHGIVGKDIPIMARLAEARRWSKR